MDKVGKKVRKRAKEKPYIPDEIITNILIRLPVKSVVRFGLVCKKWRDITLSRDFVDLHLKTSIPLILVGRSFRSQLDYCAIDKWWDLSRTRSMIHRFPFCAADFPLFASIQLFSHDGLIVLKETCSRKQAFVILNPSRPRTTKECVKIRFPSDFLGDICSVYYHPSLKEYCSLWKIVKSGPSNGGLIKYDYKLLVLSSNPSFKTISERFYYRVKAEDAYPLFINNHLYWMLKSKQEDRFGGRNDILEFDIITEEFNVIPCPIPLNTECRKQQTRLLNSDGFISLILILPSNITVWRLEDHVQKVWTSTEYTIGKEIFHGYCDNVGIIALFNGKLAFEAGGILYVCNLMEGNVKKYPKRYSGVVLFLSHQTSLASLKKCRYSFNIIPPRRGVGI